MSPMDSQARPPEPSEPTWQAEEVVQIVDHKPHLVVQIAVTGAAFPHRALVPVMRLVQGERIIAHSWFTEISNDNRALLGYFPTDLPEDGTIEFGYPDQLDRVPLRFDARAIKRLDRQGLAKEVVDVSSEYVRRKRGY